MSGFQGGAMTLGSNSGMQFQQNMVMINSLRKSLNLAIQQNSTLKSRLKKIYLDADISDIPEVCRNCHFLSHAFNLIYNYKNPRKYLFVEHVFILFCH